ncbi:MAG: hypothetical protein NW226_23380 [Microscillaceae bacterium]|nr:hypothetical protein [Microscillaceae bacterium]
MITENSFGKTWIEEKSSQHRNADQILLEKMIYALSFLEHLQIKKLNCC